MVILSQLRTLSKLAFGRYLLLTNVALGTGELAAGDIFTQFVFERDQKHIDKTRLNSSAIVGASTGVLGHYWYKWLDGKYVGTTRKIVTKKVALDLFVGAPIFNVLYFLGFPFTKGGSLDDGIKSLKNNFIPVYAVDLVAVPVLSAINFLYVQPKYRVLYVVTFSTFWGAFLSFMQHRPVP